MLKLSVTTPDAHLNPTTAFKELDNRADLHALRLYTIDCWLPNFPLPGTIPPKELLRRHVRAWSPSTQNCIKTVSTES